MNNHENKVKLPDNVEILDAKTLWKEVFDKELNTKKNILDYISLSKVFIQEGMSEERLQETYNFIYNSIENLGGTIKVNTKMYLKNQLKAEMGKYVKIKDPKPINYFIEFFKEAYPEDNRRKDFTWTLTDISKVTDEQIWTTLAYIHGWLLKEGNVLQEEQKKDIIKMVELIVKRRNIKYINNIRSLENLLANLNIKIVTINNGFLVRSRKKE